MSKRLLSIFSFYFFLCWSSFRGYHTHSSHLRVTSGSIELSESQKRDILPSIARYPLHHPSPNCWSDFNTRLCYSPVRSGRRIRWSSDVWRTIRPRFKIRRNQSISPPLPLWGRWNRGRNEAVVCISTVPSTWTFSAQTIDHIWDDVRRTILGQCRNALPIRKAGIWWRWYEEHAMNRFLNN